MGIPIGAAHSRQSLSYACTRVAMCAACTERVCSMLRAFCPVFSSRGLDHMCRAFLFCSDGGISYSTLLRNLCAQRTVVQYIARPHARPYYYYHIVAHTRLSPLSLNIIATISFIVVVGVAVIAAVAVWCVCACVRMCLCVGRPEKCAHNNHHDNGCAQQF